MTDTPKPDVARMFTEGQMAMGILRKIAQGEGYLDAEAGTIDVRLEDLDPDEVALLGGLRERHQRVEEARGLIAQAERSRVQPGVPRPSPITEEDLAEARRIIDNGGVYESPWPLTAFSEASRAYQQDGITQAARENDPEVFNVGPILQPSSFVRLTEEEVRSTWDHDHQAPIHHPGAPWPPVQETKDADLPQWTNGGRP